MYKKLFIPGPVTVHPEIMAAMMTPMIGHRMEEYAELHGGIIQKLRPLLGTEDKIFLSASSAFGVMEGAIRNLVGKRCVNFCNGAFSDKWHEVTKANGKAADAVNFSWGLPVLPEAVRQVLATGKYDAMTMIHNETSTGTMSDLSAIAEVMRDFPDVMFIVDTVSSMSAVKIPVDEMGIDCCIFGVQKAFALPPGLAVFTASEKALKKAATVQDRGYYFDFLEFANADIKNNTPSTPVISLLFALNAQLDRMKKEGFAERFMRHEALMTMTHGWAEERGFELFPRAGAYSRTVTCIKNSHGINLALAKKSLGAKGYAMDDGYGNIKGKTFRIGHMGDMTRQDLGAYLYMLDQVMGFDDGQPSGD